MARVKVTMHLEVDEEDADPDHPMGMTEDAYDRLMGDLLGFDDVEVEAVPDE
jgi:hypothetical protein